MKVLIIPDIHGKTVWKEALENHEYERVVFLGDFVDADWNVPDKQIKDNLLEIIDLKNTKPEMVTLLVGNHDIHYMFYPSYPCSGFREELQPKLTKIYNTHIDHFQVAWQYKNYLFTHAGVSQNWVNKYSSHLNDSVNLGDKLNSIFQSPERSILFEVGERRGGYGIGKQHGGPVWADKSETEASILPDYHQIVGHSKVPAITKVFQNDTTSFTYCDCLDWKKEFLVLEI